QFGWQPARKWRHRAAAAGARAPGPVSRERIVTRRVSVVQHRFLPNSFRPCRELPVRASRGSSSDYRGLQGCRLESPVAFATTQVVSEYLLRIETRCRLRCEPPVRGALRPGP